VKKMLEKYVESYSNNGLERTIRRKNRQRNHLGTALDSILKMQKEGREREELEKTQKVMRDFEGEIEDKIEESLQMRENSFEFEDPAESKLIYFMLL
jgi:hypothetical protein